MKCTSPLIKPTQVNYPTKVNLNKLRAKGKKLYALLYLPTGEFITWSNDENDIVIGRGYTAEAMAERVNDPDIQTLDWMQKKYNSTWRLIERNEITLPSIPQHYEKVELIYSDRL